MDSDGTGTHTLSMVSGNASTWAAQFSNPQATAWGGGLGIRVGCLDVSELTGIQLTLRGTTPEGSASVALVTPNEEAVNATVPISDTWQLVQVAFTYFIGPNSAAADVREITNVSIAAHMVYVQRALSTWL